MPTAIVAVAVFAMVLVFGVRAVLHREAPMTPAEQAAEDRDYAWLHGSMSKAAFHAIRAKNKREEEQFGNGDHAPYWPREVLNGGGTLYRGVWVDDSVERPSDRVLDQFREAYWHDHEIVRYTLVEGEQLAPYGKDRAMIRVRASVGSPSEVTNASGAHVASWPSVNVSPVDSADGFWASSFTGSLPAQMSYVRKKRSAQARTEDAVAGAVK